MKNPQSSETGVSELVGSILMIAVLVMAVSIAGIYLLSQPRPEKIPSLHGTVRNDTQKIYLSHDGGDPLDYAYTRIFVDGIDKTSSFYLSTATGQPWTTWSIGNVLVYVTGSSPVSIIQVVYTGTGSSAVGLATFYVGPGGGGGVAPDPVTASFSGSPTSGFVPFGVQFTDASTGPLVSWLWSFGDGGISTEQNPLHTYSTPSTFTVSLTVSNGSGSSIQTRTNYIAGYLPIIADFTGTPQSGAAPLWVSFTDTSTNTPTSWKWEYSTATVGWTQFSTAQNPSFTFPTGIYSINLTASNAGGSDYETKNNYITVTPSPPWYCGWNYRKNITTIRTQTSGSNTDFPVLINLASDSDLAGNARSDGYDILFTSSDGTTKLSHEIENFTKSNGDLVAWVKVPTISSDANTTIFMYYGCTTASDQQYKNGVWDTSFKGVWHLNEGTGVTAVDSTSNANSAKPVHNPAASTGQIGGALTFASPDNLTIAAASSLDMTTYSDWTMSAWVRPTSYASLKWPIIYCYGNYRAEMGLAVQEVDPDGRIENWINDAQKRYSNTAVTLNAWNHVTITRTATTTSFYLNGIADGSSDATTVNTAGENSFIGGWSDGKIDYQYLGLIDEVRLSASNTTISARSADWILTEYNNQYSPSTFYSIGNQEQWTC